MFCNSIALGFNTCLDTIVSQAFGRGSYRLCGVYTNRVRVVNVLFFLAICGVLGFTETLLLALGQDPEIAAIAQTYVVTLLPCVFVQLQWHITNRFLQAQGIFRPQMYMSLFGGIMHIWISYLFILHTDMGVRGAAFAALITFSINFTTFFLYARFSKHTRHTYAPFSWDALTGDRVRCD